MNKRQVDRIFKALEPQLEKVLKAAEGQKTAADVRVALGLPAWTKPLVSGALQALDQLGGVNEQDGTYSRAAD
jgi:hypothetical protein